ncbi:uncharacterized protein LOC106759047 [Vigna radiata var. radiata]|uniref:Uncharacterized protein LOC106759047 n=1 Tax=Vigna radiata var. radiata TaxID=3916 RepID=A0A1S3TUW9_VIGRR|nr:uncharacterized protein LOC106759047 [Vigna radiata var. radiata]
MKKKASTRLLMWVMICLNAYLIIAAVSLLESNDSTSVCNGSVEDCLRLHHLDSQLPTVSSSHFRRILAGANDQKTAGTADPNNPAIKCKKAKEYTSCLAAYQGQDAHCGTYNRGTRCS